jgi:hypothetical protein
MFPLGFAPRIARFTFALRPSMMGFGSLHALSAAGRSPIITWTQKDRLDTQFHLHTWLLHRSDGLKTKQSRMNCPSVRTSAPPCVCELTRATKPSSDTQITLQNEPINCKNGTSFIYKPHKTQWPFLVILIYVLTLRGSLWAETCSKQISHIHNKQPLYVTRRLLSLSLSSSQR